ncbi:heterokaryon incompatibility protein [Colletotrichum cuscutae]|uniref:Heterokaryon incompatibility protein n=1 Tax=Colletotrichum cuscutae TaxID=1209917 RepID=A0AAI9YC95_9PEZI|nr:heterokaryon incompatibility protein [Colletotrichum cuscutae]
MTVRVVPISLEHALKKRSGRGTKPESFDFFHVLGTTGCSVQCAIFDSWSTLSRAGTAKLRAEHDNFTKHGKKKVARGKSFTYGDLSHSAQNGCRSCKALNTMFDSALTENFGPIAPSTTFRWTGKLSGTLEMDAPDGKVYYVRLFNVAGSSNVFRRLQSTNGVAGVSDRKSNSTAAYSRLRRG